MLSYEQARQKVIEQISEKKATLTSESIGVRDALGFVLAETVKADRDYPPFDRSVRDGYAVRAAEIHGGAMLRCVGEVKAGDAVVNDLTAGTCVQIMTGAPLPLGADAVVMIEHTQTEGTFVKFTRDATPKQNIVSRGSEATRGQAVLHAGTRLGYAELALAAQVGAANLRCASKPRVAILSTGDEIVAVDSVPGSHQIRNSNSVSLAAQTRLAGGAPTVLGNAADRIAELRQMIAQGLAYDVLVLSGGVSMGKYDLVEAVLKEMGSEFYFDAVAIRPGKPTVFARCGKTFVFGLPGNPVSTMVTFELFVVPAMDLLSGAAPRPLPFVEARLRQAMSEKPGLAHFLPARLEWDGIRPQVRPLRWQGSGDIVTLAQANCFLVVGAEREKIEVGESVPVLLRKDVI